MVLVIREWIPWVGRCRTGTREVRFTTGWDSERESAPSGTQADRRRKAQLYAARGGRVQLSAPLRASEGCATRPPRWTRRAGRRRRPRRSPGGPTGPDWDRYADEYQATHGDFLGDVGFVWGPEGLTEDRGRRPRRRRRPRRARGRLGRRPVLALGAHPGRPGRRPRPLPPSAPALAADRRGDRRRGAVGARHRDRSCRSPTPPSTSCSRRSARCSSSATSTSRSRRPRGCCGPAAGSRSRSPTRPGGCSPTTRPRRG